MTAPLRVLAVHGALHTRLYECSEVWQYLTAMVAHPRSGALQVSATDGETVYRVVVRDGRGEAEDSVPLPVALQAGVDVVCVFGALPWTHLLVALRARRRGARVVFVPLALLTRDFGRGSWYLGRGRIFRRAKPVLVRLLALLWGLVSSRVVCASMEEVRQSRFPRRKTVLLPWPHPDTPLGQAARSSTLAPEPEGPVALVTRVDPWRKGFDRVLAWLEGHGDDLPRPALLLLAPRSDAVGPIADRPDTEVVRRLDALEDLGLLEWDATTMGTDLIARLADCRGVLLLSRWDGQPRALREALLLGLPVLTNRSSHLTEVLDLLGAGVVVDGDDPVAVHRGFQALKGIAPDPGTARMLFDDERIATFLIDLLERTVSGAPPAASSYYAAMADEEHRP